MKPAPPCLNFCNQIHQYVCLCLAFLTVLKRPSRSAATIPVWETLFQHLCAQINRRATGPQHTRCIDLYCCLPQRSENRVPCVHARLGPFIPEPLVLHRRFIDSTRHLNRLPACWCDSCTLMKCLGSSSSEPLTFAPGVDTSTLHAALVRARGVGVSTALISG